MVHELTLFRGTLERTEGGKQTVCFNVFEERGGHFCRLILVGPFFCRKRTPLMACSDLTAVISDF